MNKVKWQFTTLLNETDAADNYEIWSEIKLPADLKLLMTSYNAGMPDLAVYDTERAKSRVFGGLLSLNATDEDNIYDFSEVMRENGFPNLVPFALDPFGNLLCVDNGKIVFWDHETKATEYVADNIGEVIAKLRATE